MISYSIYLSLTCFTELNIPLGPFMLLQMSEFHSFYDGIIFHYIDTPHLLYPLVKAGIYFYL